ncbi:hypothetical protein [Nocardiopsis sp. CC223A]|uniref:hypothetical protein n=1 Tax=Nocardiopsis sp. CC223A TaxID=3044051 RepID=UPI00278C11E7|nr:hypothetical protein [Nocardiopsis sp. CC223A]
MGTAPFDPSSFFVPDTDPDRLEYTADDLKGDGADIAEGAADIHTAWGGLASCYSAPEAGILFSAVDSVPEDAEEVDGALGTAATALATFAEKARKLRKEAWALQGDARRFNTRVADDEDWAQGTLLGGESEEYTEYTRINSEKIRIQNDFMVAETECANALLALFSARRFTPVNPDGSTELHGGEIAYGFTEVTEELENAWGEPKIGVDHYWFWDVQHAAWDFRDDILENAGGMVGMHGAGGWDFDWSTNLDAHWWGVAQGAGAAVGLYDAEIDHWGFQSWERSREIAWDSAVEAAHAIVPWEEWEERPAYVITTLLLNVGTIAAGVALSATGFGAVVGVPLLAYKGLKILDGIGGVPRGLTDALQNLVDSAASGRHGGVPGSGGTTPVVSLTDSTLRGLGIDPQRLRGLLSGLETLRSPEAGSPAGDGAADAERPADPTAAELAAGQEFLDGVDPRSRTELEEGLRDAEDLWVTSQVPDDVSSVNDTPVQRYETDPALIEAEDGQRVDIDSAGNEITAHHDTTITNNTSENSGSLSTPSGTTAVAPDSGSISHSGMINLGLGGGSSSGGTSGGGTGQNLSSLATGGASVRLEVGQDGYPGPKERFGDNGLVLQSDTTYRLFDSAGSLQSTYRTDANGDIVEIRLESQHPKSRHPEMLNPRPNATYVVNVGNSEYTFKTDSSRRTVYVEGELEYGNQRRNLDEQGEVNKRGRRYFGLLNDQILKDFRDEHDRDPNPGEVQLVDVGNWNGGHLFGSAEFLGPGERLNQAPMLDIVNQERVIRPGISGSFRRAEWTWYGLLRNDKNALIRGLGDDYNTQMSVWQPILAAGPNPPKVEVAISLEDDPAMKPIPDPKTGELVHPPPAIIHVEWSINGVRQDPLEYDNHPK